MAGCTDVTKLEQHWTHKLSVKLIFKKYTCRGPWWLSGKEAPASARATGSIPGPGRSHMPRSNSACAWQLLSLCARAQEPQ